MATPGKALKRCRNIVRLVINNARQGQPIDQWVTHPATPRSTPTSSATSRSTSLVGSSSVEDLLMARNSAFISTEALPSNNVEDLRIPKPVAFMPTRVERFSDDNVDDSEAVPNEGVRRLVRRSGLPSLLNEANASRTAEEDPRWNSINDKSGSGTVGPAPNLLFLPITARLSQHASAAQMETTEDVLDASYLSLPIHPVQTGMSGCLTKPDMPKRDGPAKTVKLSEEAEWIMYDEEEPQEPAMLETRPIRLDGSTGKMLPRCMLLQGMSVSASAPGDAPLGLTRQAQLARCKSFESFDHDADLFSIPGFQKKRETSAFPSCVACTSVSTADEFRYAADIE